MTRGEAVNWIINIMADIGKVEHRELWHYEQALSEIREMIESEPERKERRRNGRWICVEDGIINGYCSYCGFQAIYQETDVFGCDYCPNCGATMEEGADDVDAVPVVRCKDCIHNGSVDTDCPISWNGKEYCSFAERRTNGRLDLPTRCD